MPPGVSVPDNGNPWMIHGPSHGLHRTSCHGEIGGPQLSGRPSLFGSGVHLSLPLSPLPIFLSPLPPTGVRPWSGCVRGTFPPRSLSEGLSPTEPRPYPLVCLRTSTVPHDPRFGCPNSPAQDTLPVPPTCVGPLALLYSFPVLVRPETPGVTPDIENEALPSVPSEGGRLVPGPDHIHVL